MTNNNELSPPIDLFNLIGGSWPPAPREPEHPEYGSAPISPRRNMQRTTHNERIKSANLINHLVPDRRKNKPSTSSNSLVAEDYSQITKMVHEPKKTETALLVGM
ncbi:unnamed protein product [Euphydryas editha]|uniref:Uncharacterized protein n=1 Tax=Euphydryas editha TaxID=104508 RepID=A0AAU9UYM6_EUPED|nr:unnamed protein product [Euphydryas editha]